MGKWQRVLYHPNLPLGKNGERVTGCREHILLSKEAAKEGMVLLKNDGGLLPLEKGTKLALFGKGSFDYVKGGGGSGDVTVAYIKNLYEGLKAFEGEIQIFEELSEFYRKDIQRQYAEGKVPGMTKEPELPEELCRKARSFADTAIISICRFSGEGWDRRSTYDATENGPDELFEDGDFYLSHAEKAMVEKVEQYFDRIVVVLNVGGMVDTEWFAENEKISSALLALQGGMEGGVAAAELLLGHGNPSGKLSDTFAKRLEDYPSSYNFHESKDYVNYTEDIYVGYRYFETIPEASQKVNYPFGYGLSYTAFAWSVVSAVKEEEGITLSIQVTNTGKRKGKEVIQLYGSAPQGLLGKPARVLMDFEKTRLLQPGESQLLTFRFSVNQLASYDDTGIACKSAYVLEAGEYHFLVGNSVRNAKDIGLAETVPELWVVEQLTSKLAPTSLEERLLSDGTYEKLSTTEGNDPNATGLDRQSREETDGWAPAVRAVKPRALWGKKSENAPAALKEVAEGKISLDEFLAQLGEEEIAHLLGGQPNLGAANTFGIGNLPDYGVPNIMTADGPAGLRIDSQCGIRTTAFPCATLLACTWNRELAFQVGEAGAKEVKENNIAMWLTPAINIHRSPLCGRNFEYYSEDPFLAGTMAAELVKGIQSQHISAAVKHFALNNKETNRQDSDSRVSERAAREIYLKAFEIIVKTAKPWCIMSSYNIINGHRASESSDLLTGILREEWGYEGMVTTDWWTHGEHYKEVKAGNDLKMACGFPERLLAARKEGLISKEEMETCAKRILSLILKID